MLALLPVVALGAACNGVAPTSSTGVSTDVSAAEGNGVAATGLRNQACRAVAGIDLHLSHSLDATVWVEASYTYLTPQLAACPAPEFTSNRPGLQTDKANPFRAGHQRALGGEAIVKAMAPNGVTQSIVIKLGPGTSDTDPAEQPTVTNPAPAKPGRAAENGCKYVDVVAVSVQKPTFEGGDYTLTAKYSYSQPTLTTCTVAPTWEATRKGLTVNPRDGFKASLTVSDQPTTVVVTAPSGVQTKVQL
jgi:hypothetical protein